jgi:hypothetical protein
MNALAKEVLVSLQKGENIYEGIWVGNENFIVGKGLNIGDLEVADVQLEAEKINLYVQDISVDCDCGDFDCPDCGSETYKLGVFENAPVY